MQLLSLLFTYLCWCTIPQTSGFVLTHPTSSTLTYHAILRPDAPTVPSQSVSLKMATPSQDNSLTTALSWEDLKTLVGQTSVGTALNKEVELRSQGKGSAHVQNTLRLFDAEDTEPKIILYRDHAGWCPYW